jgi:hypothetical protein
MYLFGVSSSDKFKKNLHQVVISEVSKTAPEAPVTRPAKVALARRASSSSGCEDAEEKRQKFLERNRYVLLGLQSKFCNMLRRAVRYTGLSFSL